MQVPVVSADELKTLLPYKQLIEALRQAFVEKQINTPDRLHYQYPSNNGLENTLLIMPSWKADAHLGIKIVTVTPENHLKHMPTVQALMLIFDVGTGSPLMIMDGSELTIRRTAAASALSSGLLSRENSRCLLIVGTGKVATQLAQAHSEVRKIKRILVWGRSKNKAQRLAAQLKRSGYSAQSVDSLQEATEKADIISCATLSQDPLIMGRWLKPGQHLDLIGSFKPTMREADLEAVLRSRLFVDTKSAQVEAGELKIALDRGDLPESHIIGDLFYMCNNPKGLRTDPEQITCFKSVGFALEDLVAATLVFNNFHYNEE